MRAHWVPHAGSWGFSVSASYVRGQLERKVKQRIEAERKAGEYRAKESSSRSKAAEARARASRASSFSQANSSIRDADRHERSAESAGKESARWQSAAASYAKEESSLMARLAREEQQERDARERERKRDERRAVQRLEDSGRSINARLDETDRRLDVVLRQLPTPRPEKLRILLLGSAAAGDLRIGREQQRIRKAVQTALHRDHVELDARPAATADDLLDGISRFRPHVVHFSGHSGEDLVEFEDDVDEFHDGAVVTARAFAAAIAATDTPPLLVLLNSCGSKSQAEALVRNVVPFAIGMTDDIDDGSAISFAAQFYAAVANGQSIWSALESGRAALLLTGLDGSELPSLVHSQDADPRSAVLVTGTMPTLD